MNTKIIFTKKHEAITTCYILAQNKVSVKVEWDEKRNIGYLVVPYDIYKKHPDWFSSISDQKVQSELL